MQPRLMLDGIPTLTCPKNSDRSIFDPEADVLERWLDLADKALALTPSPTHRRRHHMQSTRFGFGRSYRRHKSAVSIRIGPLRHRI
jgi:hypothetical protein